MDDIEDLKDRPLDHIMRPDLPWRVAVTTECGKAAKNVKSVIGREAFNERLKKYGRQRTAFTVCMTCAATANRWADFRLNPVDALRREVYGGRTEDQFEDELRAIAALVEAHREEFDQYLSGLKQTVQLLDRAGRRRRQFAADNGFRGY